VGAYSNVAIICVRTCATKDRAIAARKQHSKTCHAIVVGLCFKLHYLVGLDNHPARFHATDRRAVVTHKPHTIAIQTKSPVPSALSSQTNHACVAKRHSRISLAGGQTSPADWFVEESSNVVLIFVKSPAIGPATARMLRHHVSSRVGRPKRLVVILARSRAMHHPPAKKTKLVLSK
jgi:hypothetical protein